MRFSSRLVLSTLATTAALVLGGSPALAVTDPTPVGPAWVPDGPVHATVQSGGLVYVGGSFTGGVAALNASTGELVWTGAANGDVRALASAPNGGLLIGGAFTTVDGAAHRKLALLDGTGKAVPTWKAGSDGLLYVGGHFTMIASGGPVRSTTATQPRFILAAFNPADGALQPFSARFASSYPGVWALTSGAGRLYVGGHFTAAGPKVNNVNKYPYLAMFAIA